MVVISYNKLKAFYNKYPDSEDALNNWYRLVCTAEWKTFHEMKKMYNTVDAVGNDRFVFNIRGNKYRLITMIFFNVRTVYIRYIGLHKDYDKIDPSMV